MEIKILESLKNEIKIEIESLTIAELLRVYLNEDSAVTFAAWKREHPTENIKLLVKTKDKDPKKIISNAISTITKDLERVEKDFSKIK